MDQFKKWLEDHPTSKEFYETDLEEVWNKVDKELSDRKRLPIYAQSWVKWAAAILILAIAGLSILNLKDDASEGYALSQISGELADTENYYSTLLGEKLEIIKASKAEIDPQLFEDFDQLNLIYRDLMVDLKDNADNEEVVEAMIENYRIRVQMLERILNEIQDQDNEQNDEASI